MDAPGLVDAIRESIGAALGSEPNAEPVTVVSGLPRSGTSMMMQMLDRGGLAPLTDHERQPDEDNPKGYYELERVKRLPEGDDAWVEQARGRAVKVVSGLLAHLPEAHTYRILFMQRDLEEVLASQRRMIERQGGREALDDDELAEQFRAHLADVRRWAEDREHIAMRPVDYNAMLDDPWPELRKVDAFLPADLDPAAMAEVVDPDLYRQRR